MRIVFIFLFICGAFVSVTSVRAIDLSSTNFIIRDPVVGTGGGYGSSSSFGLFSTGHDSLSAIGSSTSFIGRYGFQYYPLITPPVLTADVAGADVELSWTASVAAQGFTVSEYEVGIATVSGGPYTFTSAALDTDYTYENLTPGDYCFIVRTLDALGYVIATSNEECVTIDSVIMFDIDTAVSYTETPPPYSVTLGAIIPADPKVSGSVQSINKVFIEGSSNSAGGIVITVLNANGEDGLVSTSNPSHKIESAGGTIASDTDIYGLCVDASALIGFSRAGSYSSGSCTADVEGNDVPALTTTGESMLTSGGSPVSSAYAEIIVNAGVSDATPAHPDYSDVLTFTATSSF